jgi:hypothetical protein
MWINSDNYRFFHCKFYFSNPHYDIFRNMYFKDRVAESPKCFGLRWMSRKSKHLYSMKNKYNSME